MLWCKLKCLLLREPDRGRLRKTWKEVVDNDVDDVHIKLNDAIDHRATEAVTLCQELNMNCTFPVPAHPGLPGFRGHETSLLLCYLQRHIFCVFTVQTKAFETGFFCSCS